MSNENRNTGVLFILGLGILSLIAVTFIQFDGHAVHIRGDEEYLRLHQEIPRCPACRIWRGMGL